MFQYPRIFDFRIKGYYEQLMKRNLISIYGIGGGENITVEAIFLHSCREKSWLAGALFLQSGAALLCKCLRHYQARTASISASRKAKKIKRTNCRISSALGMQQQQQHLALKTSSTTMPILLPVQFVRSEDNERRGKVVSIYAKDIFISWNRKLLTREMFLFPIPF